MYHRFIPIKMNKELLILSTMLKIVYYVINWPTVNCYLLVNSTIILLNKKQTQCTIWAKVIKDFTTLYVGSTVKIKISFGFFKKYLQLRLIIKIWMFCICFSY